jgi:hypothetical protein
VNSAPIVLETVTRTALLGVRFWDRVTGRVVADGLQVVESSTGIQAVPNRSGVFVVHDFPALRQSAFGSGDNAFWRSPPAAATTRFTVVDIDRRFLPLAFGAEMPLRGFFTEDCGLSESPPDAAIGAMPLFSAPSRVAPAGIAAVRADLWDSVEDAPAAWAVLEVSANGAPVYRGVADELGRVVVLLPYPEPPWQGSSPPPGARSLSDQTWPLTLAVRYAPPAASPPLPDRASGEAPDVCAVLTQVLGTLLGVESPATPLGSQTLVFGRELVLRTPGLSVLLVLSA